MAYIGPTTTGPASDMSISDHLLPLARQGYPPEFVHHWYCAIYAQHRSTQEVDPHSNFDGGTQLQGQYETNSTLSGLQDSSPPLHLPQTNLLASQSFLGHGERVNGGKSRRRRRKNTAPSLFFCHRCRERFDIASHLKRHVKEYAEQFQAWRIDSKEYRREEGFKLYHRDKHGCCIDPAALSCTHAAQYRVETPHRRYIGCGACLNLKPLNNVFNNEKQLEDFLDHWIKHCRSPGNGLQWNKSIELQSLLQRDDVAEYWSRLIGNDHTAFAAWADHSLNDDLAEEFINLLANQEDAEMIKPDLHRLQALSVCGETGMARQQERPPPFTTPSSSNIIMNSASAPYPPHFGGLNPYANMPSTYLPGGTVGFEYGFERVNDYEISKHTGSDRWCSVARNDRDDRYYAEDHIERLLGPTSSTGYLRDVGQEISPNIGPSSIWSKRTGRISSSTDGGPIPLHDESELSLEYDDSDSGSRESTTDHIRACNNQHMNSLPNGPSRSKSYRKSLRRAVGKIYRSCTRRMKKSTDNLTGGATVAAVF